MLLTMITVTIFGPFRLELILIHFPKKLFVRLVLHLEVVIYFWNIPQAENAPHRYRRHGTRELRIYKPVLGEMRWLVFCHSGY